MIKKICNKGTINVLQGGGVSGVWSKTIKLPFFFGTLPLAFSIFSSIETLNPSRKTIRSFRVMFFVVVSSISTSFLSSFSELSTCTRVILGLLLWVCIVTIFTNCGLDTAVRSSVKYVLLLRGSVAYYCIVLYCTVLTTISTKFLTQAFSLCMRSLFVIITHTFSGLFSKTCVFGWVFFLKLLDFIVSKCISSQCWSKKFLFRPIFTAVPNIVDRIQKYILKTIGL